MKNKVIKIDKLTKKYNNFIAVNSINIELDEGSFFGFLGPNGAGKTTTIKMITGLISITSGNVFIFNKKLTEHLNFIKRDIGVVEDVSNLFMDLTVYDNLIFKAMMMGVSYKKAKSEINKYLSRFNLLSKLNTKFIFLSRGQKRIVSIISSLLHKPKLLFLDEPTIGLDISVRNYIHNLLVELNRNGITIFLTSHYFEEVEKLCKDIVVINKGNIIYKGSIKKLKKIFSYENEIVLQFNKNISKIKIQKYFKKFKVNKTKLIIKDIMDYKCFSNMAKLLNEIDAKIVEIQTVGNKLDELFFKLLKRDNNEK